MPNNPQNTDPQNTDLDRAMMEILTAGNSYAYSVLTAIERSLQQFHLSGSHQPCEILHSAYLRGQNLLRQGGTIDRPHAWLKATAYNIVREISRRCRRVQTTDCQVLEQSIPSHYQIDAAEFADIERDLEALRVALLQLVKKDPEGFHLLFLRYVEGLSWSEIRQQIYGDCENAPTEAALRQRLCRCKKHLRQLFHGVS